MAAPSGTKFVFSVSLELSPALSRRQREKTGDEARVQARATVAKWLGNYIRNRIQKRGMGAEGRLKGYSTRPVKVSQGLLTKRVPAGGFPKHYSGGYKEYREDVGLQTSHFAFTNTGYSMSTFAGETRAGDPSSPIFVGFTDGRSVKAADAAIERDREHMFAVNDKELDKLAALYLKSVTSTLWDPFFEKGGASQDTASLEDATQEEMS